MSTTEPEVTDRREDNSSVLAEIEYMGFRFSVYEKSNSSNLWLDGTVNGARRRRSTGCSRYQHAVQFVIDMIEDLAERMITGQDLRRSARTLKQVWSLFEREKLPCYDRRQHRSNLRGSVTRVMESWGSGKVVQDIDAHDIRQFVDRRVEVDDVKTSTAVKDIKRLCTVLNWATRRKIDTRPVLSENPIDWEWVPNDDGGLCQPVTGHDRFLKILPFTRTVGSTAHRGYCTTMWVLGRYTGRRIASIRSLRYEDLLLSAAAIRRKVEELIDGNIIPDAVADPYLEQAPQLWEHGAVRWHPEFDKENLETWIVPLHPTARKALDHHLRRHPGEGEGYLFISKSGQAEGEPVSMGGVGSWLKKAEDRARACNVKLRKRDQDGWHALRRGWRSELPGHIEPKVAAKVGGWSWRGRSSGNTFGRNRGVSEVMDRRYLHVLPAKEYRAATALPEPRSDGDTDSVTVETIEDMNGQEAKRLLREFLV